MAGVLDFSTTFRRLQLRGCSRPPAAEEVPVVVCSALARLRFQVWTQCGRPSPPRPLVLVSTRWQRRSRPTAAKALAAVPRSTRRRREKQQMVLLARSSAGSWPSPRAATVGSAWTPWRGRLPDSLGMGRAMVVYIGKGDGCLSQVSEHPFDLYPKAAKKIYVVAQCQLGE